MSYERVVKEVGFFSEVIGIELVFGGWFLKRGWMIVIVYVKNYGVFVVVV